MAARIPATMKAAAIDRFGPPSVLRIHTLPVPEIDANEVLIAVHSAGVGIWDAKIRDGEWAEGNEEFPLVLGTDGAGEVVACGSNVRRVDVGDRVWSYAYENPKGGFYAEFVAVNGDNVARIPKVLDVLHAGAGAVTGLTALQGIDDHLEVKKGDTVLVVGGSGAVGTLAIQFARRRGARVLATATGADAQKLVRELGAEIAFDLRRPDPAGVLEAIAPDGIDAALVLAGSPALESCLDHVRRGGRIANPNGVEPPPKKRPNVRVIAYDAEVGPREWADLERAAVAAKLRVPIAEVDPLAKAPKAHERVEKGHVLGRVDLRIRRDQA
ncbi:MAG: Bifunctional protein: zinc-containing alcohol dehydrogenase [Labilithrix sp.]|nr:Bifunctional protein: zinc-containing alcohol dehydrogenase [Labilithrix sp.]